MICKRCVYVDEEKNVLSGIYCTEDNGDNFIICQCCGSIVDPTEVPYKILEGWPDEEDMQDIENEFDNQIGLLRRIEKAMREYQDRYGEVEIQFPLHSMFVHSNEYLIFNPVWE